ncbi:flotillin family protein [Psychromonas aquimarina]|uniref:flotillin family protein n=1 Tax=Psychromonas aquimarina TaxID=444919 RepID=UPI00040BEBAB|nr:hypothetical protein [Psychromonas aquimarina]
MDVSILYTIGTFVIIAVAVIVFLAMTFSAFYKKISQGHAMIVNDMSSKPKVHFTGGMVLPVVHKMEIMKISLITLEIDRRSNDGLICKDNLRADITVAFYLRVNETRDDVLKVAKSIGVERASDKQAVNELFNAKFSEALKTVGKKMNFLELFENRIQFREEIIKVVGSDLNGYALEDVAIDYLEQTPKASLDANNILDAEGIRKITEITAVQNIETNRLEKDESLSITKKNVETREAMLALERQQIDAESKQEREIETVKAREEAETQKVQQEERARAEQARLETDEQIAIREQVKLRQVEVAEQSRARAVVIEKEKVIRAQQMEVVNREREVALSEIDKDKALEEERKVIAQTISERIAVDRKVAEEEERIKEVQEVSEADRLKQITILEAEAKAQEELLHVVKQAEAEEQKAQHKAREINLMAQAKLEAASKEAEAVKKLAEGTQAEEAAQGLAEAKVLIAKADANEKDGLAQARVQEAQAKASETAGLAQAKVLEEKLTAEARGNEELGKAQAVATKEVGLSEAEILREKGKAEADALIDKFAAMNNMNKESKEFEEFRMNLEIQFKETIANIEANKEISSDQANVLASALKHANIDIVGGQGDYFDKLSKGLGAGNALNGFLEKSPVIQSLMEKLLGGSANEKEINQPIAADNVADSEV